jgi:hypothetical protein
MTIPLEPVGLGDSTAVQTRYFLGRSPRPEVGKILLIKYDGTCRSGDIGESDGRFMLAMGKAGLTAWEPDGLVFDLTGLDCLQLVDGLTLLLYLGEGAFGSENMPQAVVVGPRCEQAIRAFFLDINAGRKAEAVQAYFHDVETAMDFVEKGAAKLNALFSGKLRQPLPR